MSWLLLCSNKRVIIHLLLKPNSWVLSTSSYLLFSGRICVTWSVTQWQILSIIPYVEATYRMCLTNKKTQPQQRNGLLIQKFAPMTTIVQFLLNVSRNIKKSPKLSVCATTKNTGSFIWWGNSTAHIYHREWWGVQQRKNTWWHFIINYAIPNLIKLLMLLWTMFSYTALIW